MAITDNLVTLSGSWSAGTWTGQAITASPTLSPNVLDVGPGSGSPLADFGPGDGPVLAVQVLVAPTLATSVEFQLVQADDAGISTNVNVLASSGPVPIATLVAGARIPIEWPRATPYFPRRYVAARYVVVGTATNAGTYLASFGENVADGSTIFKNGFVVL